MGQGATSSDLATAGGTRERAPLHPYKVLAIAILLPGFGQVVCGEPRRGLTLQLFMIALGFVTWQLAAPGTSLAGRLAGGLFVYAVSITDAYRLARIRWEAFHAAQRAEGSAGMQGA